MVKMNAKVLEQLKQYSYVRKIMESKKLKNRVMKINCIYMVFVPSCQLLHGDVIVPSLLL